MLYFAVAAAAVPVEPNPWMIAPFVLLLLAIALMPFLQPPWWEKNYPKVAAALGAVGIFYYLVVLGQPARVAEVAHEYLSFVALIGSLFIVAGGIHIRVRGGATPWRNTAFLALGAVLANIIGTTGASMLLIRPWMRMNQYRITAFHVVFFIFLVGNVGGALTPIGDPPLFLGYLKGVPFFWTAQNLWLPWLFTTGALLAIFWVLDVRNFRSAPEIVRELQTVHRRFRISGKRNFWFLALILAGVFLPAPWSEVGMVVAAAASLYATPWRTHARNRFNFEPVKEVAWLFFGIFATMIPALDYLQLHSEALGVSTPRQFYAATGLLSAVLDNAPTYLTFLAAALGQKGMYLGDPSGVAAFATAHAPFLSAISLGAVFFGAATYIGNGPNFMVRAITARAKVRTPSFFGYIFQYSLPILLPVLALAGWLFLS